MAQPPRPNIAIIDGQITYRSLDAVDQRGFDDLTTDLQRRKFVEMIHRLLASPATAALSNGQAIVDEWTRSGRYLKNLRTPQVAAQAIAPLVIPPAVPTSVPIGLPAHGPTVPPITIPTVSSPPASPLAELSPRFANNYDVGDAYELSPTHGQVCFIQEQLDAPWKYAGVAFQKGTGGKRDMVDRSIYMFVRPDADNVIREQIAIKCLDVLEIGEAQVKREVELNGLVAATRCTHLLQYKGDGFRRLTRTVNGIKQNQETSFLYQELADYGDLEKLIKAHEDASKKINEHYIWYTLHELIEALSALHDGTCPKPSQPQAAVLHSGAFEQLPSKPWVPILHLDIKSDNVMLLKENKEYPSYPKPVLGDFNLSHVNDTRFQDEMTSASGPRFAGTTGWHPPERSSEALKGYGETTRIDPKYAPHGWPVNEKADIWGVGKIAHQMIFAHAPDTYEATLSKEAEWTKLQGDTHGSHFLDWESETPMSEYCSSELYNLVQQMLRHNPEQRPDLDALRTATHRGLRKHDLTYGSEVRAKQKRDIADHLQIYPSFESKLPAKYDIEQQYSPTRKRLKLDTKDAAKQLEYSQIVNKWNDSHNNSSRAAQIAVVNAFDQYFVQAELGEPSAEGWTTKHLVSCLRKRLQQDTGDIYVLKNDDINKGPIDDAMSVESKVQILEDIDDEFWSYAYSTSQEAGDAFRHAVEWSHWLLRNCLVGDGREPAEPKGAMLMNKSCLHQGMYDWIFVKPSGAFQKN